MSTKLQKQANAAVMQALEMLTKAQETLRMASRFGEEPEVGTVLIFDKVFRNEGESLATRGLSFDPDKLVPNADFTRGRIGGREAYAGKLADGGTVVLFGSADEFAAQQVVAYRHVAIRVANGKWYTSSTRKPSFDWDELVEFIGDSACWKVTQTVEIPQASEGDEDNAPISTDAPGAGFAELLGDKATRNKAMAALRKLRNNGKNPTPKQVIDALAGLDSEGGE